MKKESPETDSNHLQLLNFLYLQLAVSQVWLTVNLQKVYRKYKTGAINYSMERYS